jgi:hypothetical protein
MGQLLFEATEQEETEAEEEGMKGSDGSAG